jgi:hypothetical protein
MKTISIVTFVLGILLLLPGLNSLGQVGISTDNSPPDSSAILDLKSTKMGLLVPRMSAVQRDAINNPATGLLIYCTDDNKYYSNIGTPASPNWVMTSSQWRSNGSDIYYNTGKVGIGTANPDETLTVTGTVDYGNVVVQSGKKQTIYRQSANTDVARGNALAAAFSASIMGDNIIIGNGNYSISATLALKGSQTIILQGANIKSTNNTISIFTVTDISNWQIKGSGLLTGAGPSSGGVYTDERGISILKSSGVCSNWEITGLSFTNFRGCAIFSNATSGAYPYDKGGSIHNCNIYYNNFGIYFYGMTNSNCPHYNIISDNHLHDNINYAVTLWGGNVMVLGNTMTSNKGGIYLAVGYNHAHGIISNNEINHNTEYGLWISKITFGETFVGNHIIANDVNIYLDECMGINILGGMIYSGLTTDIKMNGTIPGYNYITNVYSSMSGLNITATTTQRTKLVVKGCTSSGNKNPSWNDIIPVKSGVADSAIRPDYSNGGILSLQALPIAIDYQAVSPIEINDKKISLDTTKAMLFNDTLTAGKIETKYHSTTTFIPKSEILTLAKGGYDSTSLSLTGFNKMPIDYSSGFVIDTLIFIGVGTSCDVTFKVRFGTNIADTGTAVVISGNAITSVSTATKISSLDNATIAKGNMVWIEPTAITTVPRRVIVWIKGHQI